MAIRARREAMPIAKCPGFGTKGARRTRFRARFSREIRSLHWRRRSPKSSKLIAAEPPGPRTSSREAMRVSARTTIRRFSSRCGMRRSCSPKRAHCGRPAKRSLPLYGIPVAVKDNIDVERPADDGGLPGLRLSPEQRRRLRRAAARGRRARHRQDQPRSVRDRPGRRALALRHPAQFVRREAHPGRLELGLGGRGRRPGSCRFRSAPIRPDRAACRPASATSSA